MHSKIDLKRTLDGYRARHGEFRVVDLPVMRYLAVDGHGDPNTTPEYADALAALYSVAYRTKFASKRELARDYVVPPLEGLWWADDMAAFTTRRDKTQWGWTMLIALPDWVEADLVATAVAQVGAKDAPARLPDVRLETLDEGRCLQTLHIGSYDDEGPVIATMHDEVMPGRSLRPHGRHHEIYLSDPRRVAPDRLRTILRQPVRDA